MPPSITHPLTPYPTAPQIEEIFLLRSKRDNEGNVVRQHDFNSYLAEDIEVVVTSQDDHLSGTYIGKDAFNKEVRGRVANCIDYTKEGTHEVVRVVGGGDQAWAAVELVTKGTTKSGKQLTHPVVYMVRFNSEGKIMQMREYFDSMHIHGHIEEHKA